MYKYPKTPRLGAVMQEDLRGWRHLMTVVEEKVDGANAAVYFEDGQLVLQSRGHRLTGGPRERLFERMWPWAYARLDALLGALEDRYVLFGEWCFAKGRIFYDALPDYFLAFDVWDRQTETFLSSLKWRSLVTQKLSPEVAMVDILWQGQFDKAPAFSSLIGPSRYKTPNWRKPYFDTMAGPIGQHYTLGETDETDLMEGVYVKVEDDERVIGRMKLPRPEFEKIRTDDSKWLRRPLWPNQLRASSTRSDGP